MDMHTTSTANECEFAIIPRPLSVQRAFEVAGVTDHLPFVGPASQDGSTKPI